MASKLRAVEAAVNSGIETLIASGLKPEQLPELVEGRGLATRFQAKAKTTPLSS
jgi:glutamate 5-kinase